MFFAFSLRTVWHWELLKGVEPKVCNTHSQYILASTTSIEKCIIDRQTPIRKAIRNSCVTMMKNYGDIFGSSRDQRFIRQHWTQTVPVAKDLLSIHRKSNTISENKSGYGGIFWYVHVFFLHLYLFIYCFQGSKIEAEYERGRRPLSSVSFQPAFGSRELNLSTRHVILLKSSRIYLRRRAKNNWGGKRMIVANEAGREAIKRRLKENIVFIFPTYFQQFLPCIVIVSIDFFSTTHGHNIAKEKSLEFG